MSIVFDAAVKTKGINLNDFLVTRPDLNPRTAILMRFRQKKIAFLVLCMLVR